jgi:hypothetical protein
MSTKKTRKRAYIPPSQEVVNRRERDTTSRTIKASSPAKGGAGSRAAGRSQYAPAKPSFTRTAKRLPIYFLLIFALQFWQYNKDHASSSLLQTTGVAALIALGVTIVFAPFMHAMDKVAYNRFLKRNGAVTPK